MGGSHPPWTPCLHWMWTADQWSGSLRPKTFVFPCASHLLSWELKTDNCISGTKAWVHSTSGQNVGNLGQPTIRGSPPWPGIYTVAWGLQSLTNTKTVGPWDQSQMPDFHCISTTAQQLLGVMVSTNPVDRVETPGWHCSFPDTLQVHCHLMQKWAGGLCVFNCWSCDWKKSYASKKCSPPVFILIILPWLLFPHTTVLKILAFLFFLNRLQLSLNRMPQVFVKVKPVLLWQMRMSSESYFD